ncbi:winged helix-turn-helix domain-containing protein [Paenibacillus sp. CC-CFT747]|nr:winged helix-turn-helix domain-containing protein [Paenibacillus sp. CC-CFT747]
MRSSRSLVTEGVSLETGEIGFHIPYGSGIRWTTSKQREAFKQKKGRERTPGRAREFVFTDMVEIRAVIEVLNETDCGRLLFLQTFVERNTNRLVKGKKPMSKRDLKDTLGLDDKSFRSFFDAMACYEIIISSSDGSYAINAQFHFSGKTDNTKVIKSFSTRVRDLYRKYDPRDLGFIYKLLPFVHYWTNTICRNPNELEIERIEALSKKEIAEITGMDESTVYRKISRLQFDDMFVLAEVKRGKERFYKLNPFVFYRQFGEAPLTLQADFLIKGRR